MDGIKKEKPFTGQVNILRSKLAILVESLIERSISEEYLIETCRTLSKSDYDDVVEERSILNECGYPICSESIQSTINRRTLKISTKTNKVYDLSSRNKFCSNICYKASDHLKDQLSADPIWLREDGHGQRMASIDLYKGSKGTCGHEVIIKVDQNPEQLVNPSTINAKTIKLKNQTSAFPYIRDEQMDILKESINGLKIYDKEVAEPAVKNQESIVRKHIIPEKTQETNCLEKVANILEDWITLETLKHLLNSEQYNKVITSTRFTESINHKKEEQRRQELNMKYDYLCQKLDFQEKKDNLMDMVYLDNIQADQHLGNQSNKELADDSKLSSIELINLKLPQTSSKSQQKSRFDIVIKHLSRVLAELVGQDISRQFTRHIQKLVKTFNLTASNIMLKPIEWTLMCLFLLKLLKYESDFITDVNIYKIEEKVKIIEQKFYTQNWINERINYLLKI